MAEGGPKARRIRDTFVLLVRHPRRFWEEKRTLALVGIAVLVLAIFAVVVAYQELKRPADVHNEDVAFEATKPKAPPPVAKTVNWPLFGLNPARTRYLPAKGVAPPFRKLWRYTDRPLLEFPPIFVGGTLYAVNNSGFAFALDAKNGRTLWKRRIGTLNASSPAYSKHRLYIVNLVPGHILKLDAKTGRTIWKRDLPDRAESSPLVIGNTVYFGCENGRLYALSTVNGNERWSTELGGDVKAAPAYFGGRLFVGDYGGHMNAVDAESGKLIWQSGSLGPGFGGSGAFYSTPAVAFGRVYAGNNDGRVYSYGLKDGTLAWTYSTGGYVYSGPTVASTRHSPPSIFIGSFDGNIYSLDAKDGSVRWSRDAGGQVIGSLSAVGDIVYAAEFTNKTTSGYMMRSGRRVFEYPKGTYTPVISDGRRIYLTGYSSITALQPYNPKRLRAVRLKLRREGKLPPVTVRRHIEAARENARKKGANRQEVIVAGRQALRRLKARLRQEAAAAKKAAAAQAQQKADGN
ncbi:MAG TPA: PQQ-binding-like beta-propeller repeat protein [Solirubrobacterales bacterium]|nr:PQQ-binding-like beta-propeller repeat protein [Solirubrobacterales bacterium]